MKNYDKILNYARENNGYISARETENLGINSTFLSNLVIYKKLERVGTGVYKIPEYPIDNFYILSKCSKNMCYSHATSLYLHNMSDRIPLVYDVTVPYNYSGNLLNNKNVSLKYVKEEIFNLGIIDIKTITTARGYKNKKQRRAKWNMAREEVKSSRYEKSWNAKRSSRKEHRK